MGLWRMVRPFSEDAETVELYRLPEHHVDVKYGTNSIIAGGSYWRFWLEEMQWGSNIRHFSSYIPIIHATASFIYGGEFVQIPYLIGPGLYSNSAYANDESVLKPHIPLTPLFPYQDGELRQHVSWHEKPLTDNVVYIRIIERFANILLSSDLSKALNLVKPFSDGIQDWLGAGGIETVFGFGISSDTPRYDLLKPGYLVCFLANKGIIDVNRLRVVNHSLRVAAEAPSEAPRHDQHYQPPQEMSYMLFRIETQTSRTDWQSLAGIQEFVQYVSSSNIALQHEWREAKTLFAATARDIFLSKDLTVADSKRVVDTLQIWLEERHEAQVISKTIDLEGAENEVRTQVLPETLSSISERRESIAVETELLMKIKEDKLKESVQIRKVSEKQQSLQPFPNLESRVIFSLSCETGRPIRISGRGSFFINHVGRANFGVNVDELSGQAGEAFVGSWRLKSKSLGKGLFSQLFEDRYIYGGYRQALGAIEDPEKLHLRFESDRDFLRIPFEFLFNDDDYRDYIILKHPLARTVIGKGVGLIRKEPLSPEFLNKLHREGEKLRILLLASNTPPDIPEVDQEIEALDDLLKASFAGNSHIQVQVKTIFTEEATTEVVINELKNGDHHIIHYAGHATYDEKSPEQSHLPFWEMPKRRGNVKELNVSMLQWALEKSRNLRFVYLSCCVGTALSEPSKLLDNDFLGIADGLIQAGIPSVLSFRWPTLDDGSKTLALSFYKHLAQKGRMDTALLYARREVAAPNRDDRTWLSPILIMQE